MIGKNIRSKGFISTTTLFRNIKTFCGLGSIIDNKDVRAVFEIYVDLDYTNDNGTYIKFMSEADHEDEWLFPTGTIF